jgi:hypothetical protein
LAPAADRLPGGGRTVRIAFDPNLYFEVMAGLK